MPYGDLAKQRVQRFASFADLDRQHATIEEREDYEPHLRKGLTVWAGVDYEAIVAEAQREAGVIVWDGGNNDFSFIRPDLEVVVADPLRPSHELRYYPGELNVRRADVVVINKVNNAPEEDVRQVVENVRSLNPAAVVVKTDSRIGVDDPEAIRGRRVLVVEDGPTLTHGGMATGAGFEAARRYGASEIIDPRPYARGLMAGTYDKYPHLGPILPALGYYSDQLHDLEQTINEVPADVVVSGTPFSLESLVRIVRPVVRVSYEAVETGEPRLSEVLQTFLGRHGLLP
jgi:predicted GTPase